eukprot:SAG22_NODE_824_length_6981_cov_2.752833_2_plen_339_part_00
MAQYGHTGGWEAADHQEFLAVWLRHARHGSWRQDQHGHGEMVHDPNFVDAICAVVSSCPTAEDAALHIEWYRKYTALVDGRRAAVQAWRAARDAEQAQRRKAELRRLESGSCADAPKLRPATNEKQRKENSRKLAEWRELRKVRQEEESTARRLEEEKAEAKRHLIEARRKAERDKALAAHRARKAEEAKLGGLLAKDGGGRQRPASVSDQQLARLQQKDKAWLARRDVQKARKTGDEQARAARRQQLALESTPKGLGSTRSPLGCLQPTMTTLSRQEVDPEVAAEIARAQKAEAAAGGGGSGAGGGGGGMARGLTMGAVGTIAKMGGGRAVPSWRKT